MMRVALSCVPVLAAIHSQCFLGKDVWTADAIADLLGSPGVSGWLDARGGFALFRRAVDEADLVTLAVLPTMRRHGVGTELIVACMGDLRMMGVLSLFLEVAEGNIAADSLYRRLGFEVVGRRPSYYADGTAAILMRLMIKPS